MSVKQIYFSAALVKVSICLQMLTYIVYLSLKLYMFCWYGRRNKFENAIYGMHAVETNIYLYSLYPYHCVTVHVQYTSIIKMHFVFMLHETPSVNGITCRHLFRTCRNAIMAIQCLELLCVASFAWILGKNVVCWWFGGGKSNLCLRQDIEIPTWCLSDKYGIWIVDQYGILHCYYIVIDLDEQYSY